jgi:endonuclease/exonuclease/phosphatase family metal-dependent hydrolase
MHSVTSASMSPTTPYGALIDSRVRVVTWNLWWRLGAWKTRFEGIAQTLEELQPDLICLQEVWREGADNQAAMLAERLGMTYAFAPERAEDGVDQGIAVVSRWPLTHVASCALPVPPDVKQPGVALRAIARGPRGPLLLTTTHLVPYPHRSAERERQVRSLIEFMAGSGREEADLTGRTILAGDFNAPPDSDEIRLLTGRRSPPLPGWVFIDAWETAGDGSPGSTMSRSNPNADPLLLPDLRWDYIFVRWPSGRPGGVGHPRHAEVAGAEARNGVVPSDHYAVLADLRY